MNVRKVAFPDNGGDTGHPAPDPLLLVTKSIQVLHEFEIVAVAKPREDYHPSDLSIQAEEEFLQAREAKLSHRDPIGLDIIVNNYFVSEPLHTVSFVR